MKFRKVLSALLTAAMTVSLGVFPAAAEGPQAWNGTADTEWTGMGTKEAPYLITSAEELAGLAQMVNQGMEYDGKYFQLTADILLNDARSLSYDWKLSPPENSWVPIGEDDTCCFAGTFDGGGHKIRGIYIDDWGNYKGLFGYNTGTITSLIVSDSYISGMQYVGGIAGYNKRGTIRDCSNYAIVYGKSGYAGGIAGMNDGATIENCENTGDIQGDANFVGGITGDDTAWLYGYFYESNIRNCWNYGTVTGKASYVGGIAGHQGSGEIVSCHNIGIISGGENGVAGIVGIGSERVSGCHNEGRVTGGDGCVAGIVGYNYGTVDCSFNSGLIIGSYGYTGGIVGCAENYTSVRNCFNMGLIEGFDRYVGGLVGYNWGSIEFSYNAGTVIGTGDTGSIAGVNYLQGYARDCYYLEGTASDGIPGSNTYPVTVLRAEEMQKPESFPGFDFSLSGEWEYGGVNEKYRYPTLAVFRPVTYGDLNGDGDISGVDSGLLLQYLAEWDVKIEKRAADVTHDGEIPAFYCNI